MTSTALPLRAALAIGQLARETAITARIRTRLNGHDGPLGV